MKRKRNGKEMKWNKYEIEVKWNRSGIKVEQKSDKKKN